MTLKILRRRKLEEEARAVFDELLKFHGSAYIRYARFDIIFLKFFVKYILNSNLINFNLKKDRYCLYLDIKV